MRSKPKLAVNAAQAVRHIRAGMSDAALMQIYGISARGLERLFQKLVKAGEISQEEIDRRMMLSPQSHVVDLVSFPVTRPAKVTVNAADAVRCIRASMHDIALMDRYNLSVQGLESLFRKLVEAGEITRAELDGRKTTQTGSELSFFNGAAASPSDTVSPETQFVRQLEEGGQNRSREKYRLLAAAGIGALAGILIVGIGLGALIGMDKWRAAPTIQEQKWPPPYTVAVEALQKQAEELIGILESIARSDAPTRAQYAAQGGKSSYEECLRNCRRDHEGGDDADKVLYANCRRECVVQYSHRLKKIRQQYHTPDMQY